MLSRIGVHVKTGSRNGYGEVCAAKPAIVFAMGEGGALVEAKEKSQGHTITVYRTAIYGNHPEGLGLNDPGCTKDEAYAVADMFWPLLKDEFADNPADYYAVINESGANDGSVVKNYCWYEERMMEHAEADGYKLCLGNLFSGTPDDGSVAGGAPNGGMEAWKQWYGPLLRRGYEGGHIYGRHCYGYDYLVPLDFNSNRPFREIDWLMSQGIDIGVALTECGLHGGEYQPSAEIVIEQMTAFDKLLEDYSDMIVGAAWWTYGDWDNGKVNLQTMSADITAYLASHYSPPWTPLDYIPPPGQRKPNTIRHEIHLLPQDATLDERYAVVEYLKPRNTMFGHSHDAVEALMYHSTPEGKIVVWDPERYDYDPEVQFSWLNVQYEEKHFKDIEENPQAFKYEVWPVSYTARVTQQWGANPEYYDQFGLPGHEGVDMAAPLRSAILCVAPGKVVRVHHNPDDHNYGKHVYVLHEDGELTGYCHLDDIYVTMDQQVDARTMLGVSGSTGNSTGPHLHFLRKRPGETYSDKYGTWPYNIFDPTELLKPLAPDQFPDGPVLGPLIDLMPYFTDGQERGVLYEVQTEYLVDNGAAWAPGPQQRHQTHFENGVIYHTKGGEGTAKPAEWEQIMFDQHKCYRFRDTSPSEDQSEFYELRDDLAVPWSVWCPRLMAVNEKYERNPYVTYFKKEKCEFVSRGRQGSLLILEDKVDHFDFFTGITLADVIQLVWTDLAGNPIERYYYAKGFGLVGWEGRDRRSAISEIHSPGSRPDNVRENIDC